MDSRRFRAVAYRNKVMTVYVLGLMMSVIDGTMVNVALPTLAHEFGVPTTDIEWIAIGYLLSFAAVIPAAGWLGDRFGTKRVFVVALAIFVAMSLLCGVAQSLDQLVFFRILQGRAAVSSRRSDRRCSTAPSRWPNGPRRRSACSASR